MNTSPVEDLNAKPAFTTHSVPLNDMARIENLERAPQIGDLILAEVLNIGHHKRIEMRTGAMWHIFPGDLIVGAFGNRYATDQFEAYVPDGIVGECDLLSVGGVCGKVVSRHPYMHPPTRLRIRGAICDPQGQPLNLRAFGLPPREEAGGIILIVGSSMNAGKTTTVGTLARALRGAGFRVAAAKITGTAAGKDGRYFNSCGARPVLDFTHAGYPSTYMISLEELLGIHHTLIGHLRESNPDYILVEIADGIFQRETRMLLECEAFRKQVEHVFFAANDSLSAACGVRCLKEYDLPLRAIVGTFTQSALAMREAQEFTGLRCLSLEQMLGGGVLEALGLPQPEVKINGETAAVPMTVDPLSGNGNGNGNGHVTATNGEAPRHRDEAIEEDGEVRAPAPEPALA